MDRPRDCAETDEEQKLKIEGFTEMTRRLPCAFMNQVLSLKILKWYHLVIVLRDRIRICNGYWISYLRVCTGTSMGTPDVHG